MYCSVAQPVGHFVAQHKVAVGIGLGILSVSTGFGALLIAGEAIDASLVTAGIIGTVSSASGLGATILDGQDCTNHLAINGQCLGATLGIIGLFMSLPELAVDLGWTAEPSSDEFLFLSYLGLLAASGASLADLGLAIYNDLMSQKGLCEQT